LSGTGGLIKQGAGGLYLDGLNSYAGATALNVGALGGTGTVLGAVSVAASASIGGGDSAASGTLSLPSSTPLTLNGTGTNPSIVTMRINGAPTVSGGVYTPNASVDAIDVSAGANPLVSLGTSILSVSSTGGITAGRYQVIDNSASGALTGTLSVGAMPAGFTGTIDTATNAPSVDLVVAASGTFTWSGGSATTNNWDDPANWGGTAPTGTANEALIFPSTAARQNPNVNNLTNASFGSITFNGATAGAYNITGNGITFSGSGTVISNTTTVASAATLNLNMVLSAASAFNTAPNNTLILGSGTSGIATNGYVLTLVSGAGGTNTFSGNVILNDGALEIQNGNAFGGTPITLDYDGATTYISEVILGSGQTLASNIIVTARGDVLSAGAAGGVLGGNLTLNGTMQAGLRDFHTTVGYSYSISGANSGPGNIVTTLFVLPLNPGFTSRLQLQCESACRRLRC